MLSTDTKILNALLESQKQGHELFKYYHINYPDKKLDDEINAIHVACVSAENNQALMDTSQSFTDLVEIIISTKKLSYEKAIQVIKTVTNEIIKVLKNDAYLSQRLVVRNINPVYEKGNYLVKKGHVRLQFKTAPVNWVEHEETIEKVCKLIIKDDEVDNG